MNIQNKHLLTELQLAEIDTIWRMSREELNVFVDSCWNKIDEDLLSPEDSFQSWYGDELWTEISKRYDAIHAELERKRNATIEVDGVVYDTVDYFDVYHLGWEMDTKAWIVKKDGKAVIVHTTHGDPYFVEDGHGFLTKKVKELNSNIKKMKLAISYLEIENG